MASTISRRVSSRVHHFFRPACLIIEFNVPSPVRRFDGPPRYRARIRPAVVDELTMIAASAVHFISPNEAASEYPEPS
jgi:hypothetical protein